MNFINLDDFRSIVAYRGIRGYLFYSHSMDLPEDVNRGWSRSVRPWRMAVVTVKESIQEIIYRL
jgi:hypothetical protein